MARWFDRRSRSHDYYVETVSNQNRGVRLCVSHVEEPDPGRHPRPPDPAARMKRAHKLRQQPVAAPGDHGFPWGSFFGRHYAAANSTLSISVASSASAFELLTRFDTGQRCRKSFGAGFSIPAPASPLSQGANCPWDKNAGIRSWTSAAKSFGSVIIMVKDFSCSPVSRFFHSSQSPAAVSAGDPSRAVKYQGCFPPGVFFHS
jgi:hypothetical protein